MSYCAPTVYLKNQLRNAVRKWINECIKSDTNLQYYQVTLTFVQRENEGGRYHYVKAEVDKNMVKFINRLNRKIFGNSFYRYKKRIFSYVSIEHGQYGNNTHAHLILGFPKNREYKKDVEVTIYETIAKTPMINQRNQVGMLQDPLYWSNYILKNDFNPILMKKAKC